MGQSLSWHHLTTVDGAMASFVLKSSLFAFIVTLFCIWVLSPVAQHIGLTDDPGGRKRHNVTTPVIGGIALFFGFCFGLLTLHISLSEYRGLLGGCALLLLLGIADDIKDIKQSLRLLGQLIAAFLIIVWGGYQLSELGNLFFVGPVYLGLWGIPLTLLVVLCYINAFNMIDGQDGLAGGVALVQLVTVSVYLYQQGLVFSCCITVIASVVTFAFLCLNMPLPWRSHARVFMGDAGSTVLAYIIIWFCLELSQYHHAGFRPVDSLWIITYPVFDCVQVIIYRLNTGKSPLKAGREHLHHILLSVGFSRMMINVILIGMSAVLILFGYLLHYWLVREGIVFVIWLCLLIVYILVCNLYLKKHVDASY